MCFGEKARRLWLGEPESNLFEQRGIVKYIVHADMKVAASCTFCPQDCMDVVNHEVRLNPYLLAAGETESAGEADEDEDASAISEKRHHGKTARNNYRFWVMKDMEKLWSVVKDHGGIIPIEPSPTYILQPRMEDVVVELKKGSTNKSRLYIDIETDSHFNIRCFAFSVDEAKTVMVVPVIRYNYTPAYSLRGLASIFKALAEAFQHCQIIAHNGGEFDFFVFAYKYRIPIAQGKTGDTMIAHRRCFPEAEKSLGHCTTLWTWQPFHKDEGILNPNNHAEEQSLWRYCGKDVFTMALIQNSIDRYAYHNVGLRESIRQANEAIYPYLCMTFKGMLIDAERRQAIMDNNDRTMEQYLRVINMLVGPEHKLLPTSAKSMVTYFHQLLGYKIVARTKTGNPSLGADAIFSLKLLYPNDPVLDFCLAFRRLGKETGTLGFNPMWNEIGEMPEGGL